MAIWVKEMAQWGKLLCKITMKASEPEFGFPDPTPHKSWAWWPNTNAGKSEEIG